MAKILCTIILIATSQFFLNAQGAEFAWAKQIGGTEAEYGYSITTDGSGNIYTTGQFSGTSDFDPGSGIYNLTSFGESDIFISKLDASGNFVWAKQMGGIIGGSGYSITLDWSGNVYTTGYFIGTCDFDPGSGIYNLTSFGSNWYDTFVSKLDASGNFVWAKQMGGTNYNVGRSIAVDGSGNVYTTGKFHGTSDFDPSAGAYNLTSFGSYDDSDIFISKLDASGNFVWAKQMGGISFDQGNSIAVDGSGNIYTTGEFNGTANFNPSSGPYNLTSFGGRDIFVSKLDASGNLVWAKNMGGIGGDSGSSTAVDGLGNVYTTGQFSYTSDFDPGSGIYNLTTLGQYIYYGNTFISKLDASGNFVWAKQIGAKLGSGGLSIALDVIGDVYTTGLFQGKCDFDPNSGIYNLTPFGSTDIFVSKLNDSGSFVWAKKMGGASWDEAKSISVDGSGNVYTTGYFGGTSDFDPGSATYNLTPFGNNEIFITKFSGFPTPFQEPFNAPQYAIQQNGNQALIKDPIQLGTGTYTYSHEDFKVPSINGPLKFERFYNSINANLSGTLGYGWSHTYNYLLVNRQDTAWDIHYPDGHLATFIPMNYAGQSFPIFSGTTDSLQKNVNSSYSLYTKERVHYHFDQAGKLDSIIDLNNNITKLFYTGSKLDSIVAPGGRSLAINYNSNELVSVRDPLNRICSYSYDANSNLIRVVGPNMDTTSFTYDSLHRMLSIVNPLGDTILANTYDSTGKVISQEDVYHYVTSIAYDFPNTGDATVTHPDSSQMIVHHDVFFRKTSEIDELNFTKTYTYDNNSNEIGFTNENNQSELRLFDSFSNLLSDTLPGGKITYITYNHFNSPIQLIDANGNQKIFYRDSLTNNLDSIRNADSSSLVFTYNIFGLVTQSIDGNGNTTSYLYSPAGDLLSIQTFAGIRLFSYDAAGRKISSTDENGQTTNYVYDNNDNITLITDALNRTVINTYDANNQLLSMTDNNGYTTNYAYDKKGRKISSINPKGGITTYTYDFRDNLISITDPGNNTVNHTYDLKNRKVSSTNALGITLYQYDAAGNLVKVIDPTNRTMDYTYTATNKKQSQKDGLNNITTFGYDLNDNLISVVDPLNRVTSYGYDVKNRLVSVTDAMNQSTTITYDFNDKKNTVIDPNGHTQTYNYDAVDRLINYMDASGNNYNYSYDSVGNNLILTKPTGTITKEFDLANRVISIINSTGNNYTYTYDSNDNVITMSNSAGTSTMTYDSLNQLIQYIDPYINTVSFTYDSVGNKTSIIYPGNKTVTYDYDNANNLISVLDWLNQTFTYSYDSSGRMSQLLYPNGIHCQYGYDHAGRLIKKITRLSTDVIISGSTFNLDAVGNRISEQRLAQMPSTLSSFSRAYSYADDDRMVSDLIWNFTNDNSGNRTAETDGVYTATYNFSVDNLMNSRIDTSGMNNVYAYNPLSHRISKAVGTNVNKYVLDLSSSLSNVLQITDANGVVNSNYVYGHGLLERIDSDDNPLFYHFDAQHNTVLLTNQDTVLKDIYTYDPFGTMLSHSGTTTQPFTFLGEYGVEQESPALYYARARYYDAVNGRFLSKDAYDYDLNNPQTINRYVYSTNNPISYFDYTGLFGNQDYSSNNTGLNVFNGFVDIISNVAGELVSNPSPTSLYANGNLIYYNSGVSFLTKPTSTLGVWGGSLVGGLSTAALIYDIKANGNTSSSNYFDLQVSSAFTAVGLAVTAGFLAPAVGTAAAAIGIGYGIGNIYSHLSTGKSLSERLFNH